MQIGEFDDVHGRVSEEKRVDWRFSGNGIEDGRELVRII